MPNIQVRITNLPQIKSAFNKAPILMVKNLNIALRKAALTIQSSSAKNTPVDTGRLRASHYTQFSNLKATVGTDTTYDIFVHEGTRFMKGRPYLRQAIESDNDNIQRFFTEAVDDTLHVIAREV